LNGPVFERLKMRTKVLKFVIIFICLNVYSLKLFAQSETQERLFQKYQAMVIIEELNQHCPLLSHLESAVLNGQIVFSDSNFSGKLTQVEAYKIEARAFARNLSCNAPEIDGLLSLAQQEASDAMVNHLLLARQVYLLDQKDKEGKKITDGILLSDLTVEDWKLIEGLYQEVKDNYLNRVGDKAFEDFEQSIETVAEERTAATLMSNEAIINRGPRNDFQTVQAMATNRDIFKYYHYLENSVLAFLEGAKSQETGYPYSRPSNDFTKWTAYRERDRELNWILSYDGCGLGEDRLDCSLFVSKNNEVGLVVSTGNTPLEISQVSITTRKPGDLVTYSKLQKVESQMGSNIANYEDIEKNVELIISNSQSVKLTAKKSGDHDPLRTQVGSLRLPDGNVYMFPKETLTIFENLKENDVISISIDVASDGVERGTIPVHNFHRAKNWATQN
jgi:hypothetical protein